MRGLETLCGPADRPQGTLAGDQDPRMASIETWRAKATAGRHDRSQAVAQHQKGALRTLFCATTDRRSLLLQTRRSHAASGPLQSGRGLRRSLILEVKKVPPRARQRQSSLGDFGKKPWSCILFCSWRRPLADRHSLPFPSLSFSEGPPSRCFGPPFPSSLGEWVWSALLGPGIVRSGAAVPLPPTQISGALRSGAPPLSVAKGDIGPQEDYPHKRSACSTTIP